LEAAVLIYLNGLGLTPTGDRSAPA
jgi:hypothetical protein